MRQVAIKATIPATAILVCGAFFVSAPTGEFRLLPIGAHAAELRFRLMTEGSDVERSVVVAATGASGTACFLRLVQTLLAAEIRVHLVISDAARQVASQEIGCTLPQSTAVEQWILFLREVFQRAPLADWGLSVRAFREDLLSVYSRADFSAGIASGSFLTDGMVICPCSMGTLAALANGVCTNLIHRAADVHLKERRPLIVVPRETPLSLIAIENMAGLARAGATVLPAMPGFYHQPTCLGDMVDFVVARICDHLRIPHQLSRRWGIAEDK